MCEGRVGAPRPGGEKEQDLGSSPEGLGFGRRGPGSSPSPFCSEAESLFCQEEGEHKTVNY